MELTTLCVDNHTVTPTILIVDDHATFRTTARALLEADGYDVIGEAPDGSAGIVAAGKLHPDVVLLDVRLPDLDGFDVAERLTRSGSGPAVIVTSSSDDPLYPGRAAGCGARGFIAKHDVCGAALDKLLG
jgi:two-component system response regulator FimZ (fimbrial Z protein)